MADLLRIGSKEEANGGEDQQQEAKCEGQPHSSVRERREGKGRRGEGRGKREKGKRSREGREGKRRRRDGEEVKIGKREGKEEDKGS